MWVNGDHSSPAWKVDLGMNDVKGHPVTFKLDSGADVSAMSDSNYKQLRPRPSLKHSQSKLEQSRRSAKLPWAIHCESDSEVNCVPLLCRCCRE